MSFVTFFIKIDKGIDMVRKLSLVVTTTLFAGTLFANETTNLGQIDIFENSNSWFKSVYNLLSLYLMLLNG